MLQASADLPRTIPSRRLSSRAGPRCARSMTSPVRPCTWVFHFLTAASPNTADPPQLSSGYTAGEEDGNRYVFTMNKKRYPDFKGMVAVFHKAGIKVVPNIKPCTCDLPTSHPSISLFAPSTSLPRLTQLTASRPPGHSLLVRLPAQGRRLLPRPVDQEARRGPYLVFWRRDHRCRRLVGPYQPGRQEVVVRGCQVSHRPGCRWDVEVSGPEFEGRDTHADRSSDNNEYYLRDDDYLAQNDTPHKFVSPIEGKQKIGLLGRMINVSSIRRTCTSGPGSTRIQSLTRSDRDDG
jgi:hypothetical protein